MYFFVELAHLLKQPLSLLFAFACLSFCNLCLLPCFLCLTPTRLFVLWNILMPRSFWNIKLDTYIFSIKDYLSSMSQGIFPRFYISLRIGPCFNCILIVILCFVGIT